MTKTEAIERLDALNQAIESVDLGSIETLGLASMADIMDSVTSTPDIAHAERQAKARIGYLDRAIRSNGAAPPTNDIEKLRRRAGRAVIALRDAVKAAGPSAAVAA